MSNSFLRAPAVQRSEGVASQVTVLLNGLVSRLVALMRKPYRTLRSYRHSQMASLPNELLLIIISHFTMTQLLRFRGVCGQIHQVVGASEMIIVRQLLQTQEFWLAGKLFGNTRPDTASYKHLFVLRRRCSVVNTSAKFISEYSLVECGEHERFVEADIRSCLLLLTHYLERHRLCLQAFVSDPNNEPYFEVPNKEIEILTLAEYKHESVYHLCGLHKWLMGLLEKRLGGETLTILDRQETEGAKYAELLALGGIEAIRDSILPETFTERCNKVEMHVQRACSVCDPGVRFPGLPMRTVDLALVLAPITPLLSHQTALSMCGMLPMDYDILERLFFCLPAEGSCILWQVDTVDGASDFNWRFVRIEVQRIASDLPLVTTRVCGRRR